MKKFTYIKAMLACMVLAVLAACGGKGTQSSSEAVNTELKNVCLDGGMIINFDLDQVIENAGGKVSKGKYDLGSTMTDFLKKVDADPAKVEENLNKYFSLVETSNIIAKVFDDSTFYATVAVRDMENLKATIAKEAAAAPAIDGYDVYTDDGISIMLKDAQMWVTLNPQTVIADVNKAKTASVFDKKEVVDMFNKNVISVFIDNEVLAKIEPSTIASMPANAKYCMGYCNLDGVKATFEGYVLDSAFNKLSFTNENTFGIIKATDLACLPAGSDIVFAIGKPGPEAIKQIMQLARLQGVDEFSLTMVKQVLDGIEGSIAIAAAFPENGDYTDFAAWNATIAIGYNEDTANAFLSMVSLAGGVKDGDDYKLTVPISRSATLTIYAGYRNGQLIASTSPIGKGGFNAKDFEGKQCGFIADLKADNPIARMIHLPWGISMEVFSDASSCDGVFQLTGTSGLLLENIFKALTR